MKIGRPRKHLAAPSWKRVLEIAEEMRKVGDAVTCGDFETLGIREKIRSLEVLNHRPSRTFLNGLEALSALYTQKIEAIKNGDEAEEEKVRRVVDLRQALSSFISLGLEEGIVRDQFRNLLNSLIRPRKWELKTKRGAPKKVREVNYFNKYKERADQMKKIREKEEIQRLERMQRM